MVKIEERIEALADKIKRIYDRFGHDIAIMAISQLKISRAITQTSGFMTQIEDEAAKLWESATNQCDEVYKSAKKTYDKGMTEIIDDMEYLPQSVKQVTQALLDKTTSSMYNQTRTIAETVQQDFIQAADYAHMEIVYGKKSVYDAVAFAVSDVLKDTNNAFSRVTYPSGHSDAIEVAMLRAARTGGAQTAATVVERYCDENDIELVEVSAHYGARPEHAVWQGKVYSMHGSTSKYPNLAEATGYGTVTGLLGANCMHLYYPFFEGDERTYTDAQLKEMQEETILYDGKEVPTYELIQKQRAFERNIRKQKQDILKREAAGNDVTADKIRLKSTQNRLKKFLGEVDFTRRPEREQVYGWDRSHAAQVGAIGRKSLTNDTKSGTIKEKSNVVNEAIASGKVKKEINADKQKKHIKSDKGYVEGKSFMYGTMEDSQKLVDKLSGTGDPVIVKGKWTNKERVTNDTVIGVHINKETGEEAQTKHAMIHYSKTGSHIMPREENNK